MPDSSSTIADATYALASLERKVFSALEEAIMASPEDAAISFAEAIAPHAGIAIFFSNGLGQEFEELTVLGPDIGALFVGAEIEDDDDVLAGKFYCRTGFGAGRQISIETQAMPVDYPEIITGRLKLFLIGVESALAGLDVHVTQAIPSASLRAGTVQVDDRAERTSPTPVAGKLRYLKAGIAGLGFLVLLAGAVFVLGMHRKPDDRGVAMLPDLHMTNKMPAIGVATQDQHNSGADVGGVKIELGGFGSTKGPDLESFGIKPGPEVANDVGRAN